MKKYIFLILLTLYSSQAKQINIAAAANLAKVIYELKDEYQKHYKDAINITLNSSGALVFQIQNNAPYDIFMAANEEFANSLNKKDTKLYAKGCLAFYSKTKIKNEKDIKNIISSSNCVVIANPKTAPYGQAAYDYIVKNDLYDIFKSKQIIAHSISHALQQAKNGCDASFVALSNVLFDTTIKKENYVNIGCDIKQNVVLLNENAKDFYDFLDSQKAKEIFVKYGYE